MTRSNKLPTLDYEDDGESRQRRQQKANRLPPFVILKRALALFVGFFGLATLGSLMFANAAKGESENDQIMHYILAFVPLAVGAWLWGGKDPTE